MPPLLHSTPKTKKQISQHPRSRPSIRNLKSTSIQDIVVATPSTPTTTTKQPQPTSRYYYLF
jgi:CTP:phosphocholine cytidylyltransferase-like protein